MDSVCTPGEYVILLEYPDGRIEPATPGKHMLYRASSANLHLLFELGDSLIECGTCIGYSIARLETQMRRGQNSVQA